MQRLPGSLVERVTRRPGVTLLVLGLLTLAAGAMAGQQEMVDDAGEGTGPVAEAQDRIDEVFAGSGAPFQVLVQTPGRDVRNADVARVTASITEAVTESDAADRLAGPGGLPPVLSPLLPAIEGAEASGTDLADLDDEQVRELQEAGLDAAPDEVADRIEELLADGDPPEAALLLAFLDDSGLDDDGQLALERSVSTAIEGVEVPDGVVVEPVSIRLLLEDSEIGPEVGRLFGTAFLLILVVLVVVYWVRPAQGERGRVVRRAVADMALAALAILVAVVWMQGVGVLLGPDYVGLIGYFSPQTQVVPVIIVGLGVDYAIHLTLRYRDAVADGQEPGPAMVASARTVGVALSLATVTTAIGFLTNLVSPFDALATLGVLAAVGVIAALLVTLTLLPAARVLLDRRAQRAGSLPVSSFGNRDDGRLVGVTRAAATLAERAPAAALGVGLLLGAAGAYGFTQIDREFSFTDFVPRDSPLLDTLDTIKDAFGGGFGEQSDVLLAGDVATVEAHDALVAAVAALADVDDVASAAGQADVQSPLDVLRAAAGEGGEAADLLDGLGVGDDLLLGDDADDAEVRALYDAAIDEAPEVAEPLLAEVDGGLWGRATVRTTAGDVGAGGLAQDLEAAFAPVADAGVEVTATSQDIVAADLTDQIERSQLIAIGVALAVILVLLGAYYQAVRRRVLYGALAVAPVVLVLAWTFGAMALLGVPLTPVTATLAALSIGVGIDFSIHIVNRFADADEEAGADVPVTDLVRTTTEETGSALVGSALTTVLGFSVLLTSTLVPFQQLGAVTALAIAFALLASLLVLPSALRLAGRRART